MKVHMFPKIIIAVVTDGRSDSALQAAVSILHLQMQLMNTPQNQSFQADLRFYKSNNEALQDLFVTKDAAGLFVVHWSTGIPGPFAMKAFKSNKEVIIGVHPDGVIDWDRVRNNITSTTESLENTGIQYNVDLESAPDSDGYAKIKRINMLNVMFVKRSVVDAMARAHPKIISKDKKNAAFCLDGIYDGTYMTGPERFMRLYGKPMFAETEHGITKLAPQDFTGIVGARSVLR
jgi:hypothetical protein